MIVVKIELWPGGDNRCAREIGRTYIASVGGGSKRGDYNVAVCRRGSYWPPPREHLSEKQRKQHPELFEKLPKATRSGQVLNYPRQSYNVWRLVLRALRACFPEEK